MKTLPTKDASARTGTNLRGAGWSGFWRTRLTAARRRLAQAAARRLRAAKALFNRREIRQATKLVAEAKREWQASNARLGGGGSAWSRRRRTARTKIQQILARTCRNYRRIRSAQAVHFAEQAALVAEIQASWPGRGVVGWGGDAPVDPPTATVFTAPYALFAYETLDFDGLLTEDDSFVLPDIGHFVLNFRVEHNESDWSSYNPTRLFFNRGACGTSFTLPQAGRLRVTAQLQNIYNRIDYSITDNFGFSHSNLTVEVHLFIAIARAGGDPVYRYADLFTENISSDGDDLARTLSSLDNTLPFAMDTTTLLVFPPNDVVEIVAGAEVRIFSDTDDMNAHVHLTHWWRLDRLTIEVI
jgi:hypothetical protein